MLASRVFFSAPCILFFKFYECVMNTNFICSRLFLLLSLVCISSHHSNYAVTLVYNLKVRRIFAIAPVLKRMKSRVLLSAVPIFFARSSHLIDARTNLDACEKRRAGVCGRVDWDRERAGGVRSSVCDVRCAGHRRGGGLLESQEGRAFPLRPLSGRDGLRSAVRRLDGGVDAGGVFGGQRVSV